MSPFKFFLMITKVFTRFHTKNSMKQTFGYASHPDRTIPVNINF